MNQSVSDGTHKCVDCIRILPISEFYKTQYGKPQSYCKSCSKQRQVNRRAKLGISRRPATIESFVNKMLRAAKGRAAASGIEFDLDFEWVMDGVGKPCPMTGLQYVFDAPRAPLTPSIDKVDPAG